MNSVPLNKLHCNKHQKMPVFRLIESSSLDCKCKKSPCAVQITAAPAPRMAEDMYMNKGDGAKYISM